MRTRFLFPLLLLTAVLLSGFGGFTKAAPNSAVVDTARIFRDSIPSKAGVKFLENLHETMQAELNTLQEQLQEQLQKNPKQEELQKDPEYIKIQEKIQTVYMNYRQRMDAAQQNVITLLNDAMQRTLDTFREERGLDVIISAEAVLSYSKAVDITDAIIERLNTQKIEFKEMPLPAPTALPEQSSSITNAQTPAEDPAAAKTTPVPQAAPESPVKK